MLSTLKKILLVFFISIFLLLFSLIAYFYFNEEKITSFIISEVNKKIDTKITTSKVDFSVLKSFPYATLSLNNVEIASSTNYTDIHKNCPPLLKAAKLHVHFNLYQVIHQQLIIKGIKLEDAFINVFVDSKNENNYQFIKSDSSSGTTFKIDLKHIELVNTAINSINHQNHISFQTFLRELEVGGTLKNEEIDASLKMTNENLKLTINNSLYKFEKEINIKSRLSYQDDIFTAEKFKLESYSIKFNSSIVISKTNYTINIQDANVNTKEIINYFEKYLPKELIIQDGETSFNGTIKGNKDRLKETEIALQFNLKNIELYYKDYYFKKLCSDINLSNNKKQLDIKCFTLKCEIDSSLLEIEGRWQKGLINDLQSKLKCNFPANHLNKLIDPNLFKASNGNIEASIEISNNKTINWDKSELVDFTIQSQIDIKALDATAFYNNYNISNLTSSVTFKNQLVTINESNALINNNAVTFQLEISQLPEFLNKEKPLLLSGKLSSDTLNAAAFLLTKDVPNDSTKYYFSGTLHTQCKHLIFDKFKAEKVTSEIHFNQDYMNFKISDAKFCQGTINNTEFKIDYSKENLLAYTNFQLNNINIRKLFQQFSNFGQDQLKSDNIDGQLFSSGTYSFTFNNKNEIETNSLSGKGNIEISNGALINFKPIHSLTNFLEIKDINHVKFNKIKNTIFITNNSLNIPEMAIQSDALNFNLSGQHNFSNEYEYHFNMLLSDIFLPKIKKKKSTEFGEVEEDTLGRSKIFVKLAGKGENYKFSYDGKKAFKSFSSKMNEEKKKVKSIIKEEFSSEQPSYEPSEKKMVIESEDLKPKNKNAEKNVPSRKTNTMVEWKDE